MIDQDIIIRQREKFRNFMEKNGLTPYSWGKKAGVAEATIRHYLSGRNKSITAVNIEKLAIAAGVESDSLLSGDRSGNQVDMSNVDYNLFIQSFKDIAEYIKDHNIKLDSVTHAKVVLAWYQLAKMPDQENQFNVNSPDLISNLLNKIAVNE
ncbi:MAG: helix-turn-helix transcriptional regulator [Pseudomonadota bacterium]